MSSMYDLLMQLPVFQGIGRDEMTHILEVIPFEFQSFKKGDVICRGGEPCLGVTFLLSGRLRLVTPIFNRRVSITQLFEGPHTFSLHHMFGADMTAHSTMIADADRTGVMILHKADFLRILQEHQIALVNALNMLCTRAQKQHKAIDFSGETDPVLRLSSWILAFTERAAVEAVFEAEESDWCDMLQLDKPAFWRCVATLEGQHLLESRRGRLKLLDRYGLRSFVRTKTAQKT